MFGVLWTVGPCPRLSQPSDPGRSGRRGSVGSAPEALLQGAFFAAEEFRLASPAVGFAFRPLLLTTGLAVSSAYSAQV